jgi:hypothetical protein
MNYLFYNIKRNKKKVLLIFLFSLDIFDTTTFLFLVLISLAFFPPLQPYILDSNVYTIFFWLTLIGA